MPAPVARTAGPRPRVDLRLYALTPEGSGTASMVAAFQAMIGLAAPSAAQTSALRRSMLAEEYREYETAEDSRDLAG